MQKVSYDIVIFLIVVTSLILVMITFILSIIFLYRKRQNYYFHNLEVLKHDHEKNLLKSQIEVQEQTLQNISLEIHDNISLSLTLAKLQLNTLNIEDKEKAEYTVRSSIDLLSKSINDLSDLSKSMNATIIAQEGLIDALKNEIARISKAGFFEISTEISGSPVFLDAQKELVLFRIIQEAFNNIIKHADANKVKLTLDYSTNLVRVIVKDDGRGFDPKHLFKRNGAGLNNMKLRSKILNGDMKIESCPNSGTEILISIPY